MTTTILTNSLGNIAASNIICSNSTSAVFSKQLTIGRKNVESYIGISDEAIANIINTKVSALTAGRTNISQAQALYNIAYNSCASIQSSLQRMYEIAGTSSSVLITDNKRALDNCTIFVGTANDTDHQNNLDDQLTISDIQVTFNPYSNTDEHFTLTITGSKGEKHKRFIVNSIPVNSCTSTAVTKNSYGLLTFTSYIDLTNTGASLQLLDFSDTLGSLKIGHNKAYALQDKHKKIMFGSVLTSKLQVGSESTAITEIPIDEISNRIVLGYKNVSITSQTEAALALGEIKTGIQKLTEIMSKVGTVQAQLKRSADSADVSILQQNNA